MMMTSTTTIPSATTRRRTAWRILMLAGLWLVCTSGLRLYMMPDEGRYAGVAWEMIRSGDWGVPTLNSLPFFHKPPLFYWLTALSMEVFGVHPWSSRLASWCGAMLAVASLYRVCSRWFDVPLARSAVLVLVTTPYLFLGAQFANMDMLVAGCISLTVAAFADAVRSLRAGEPHQRALMLAWAGAGLGVLSKGLIGIVLPCASIFVWLLWTGQIRLLWRLIFSAGPLVFLTVALPWFVTMQLRYDQFFDYFIIGQHFRRFASTGFNNAQPFWFYVPVIALLTLPWAVMGLVALKQASPAAAAVPDRSTQEATRRTDGRRLLLCWGGVVLVFFSIPQSKLIGYVLPCLPPLAGLIAEQLSRWGTPAAQAKRASFTAAVAGLLCLSCVAIVIVKDTKSNEPIAAALAQHSGPTDQVVYLDTYPYDLTLYRRYAQPVAVLSHWSELAKERGDSWREELHDAVGFEPSRVDRWLVESARYAEVICRAPLSWVVSYDAAAERIAGLKATDAFARSNRLKLWQVKRSDQCPPASGPVDLAAPAKAQ